jgi:hypothetical protein
VPSAELINQSFCISIHLIRHQINAEFVFFLRFRCLIPTSAAAFGWSAFPIPVCGIRSIRLRPDVIPTKWKRRKSGANTDKCRLLQWIFQCIPLNDFCLFNTATARPTKDFSAIG